MSNFLPWRCETTSFTVPACAPLTFNRSESFIELEKLRRACPCAECKGEMDVMGNLYIGPPKAFQPNSFQVKGIGFVGGYAIQPQWADGHSTGLYSFEMLKKLGE